LPRDVGVIVVAAGRGTRFGGAVLKQYLPIAGVPVVLHALRPFTSHPDVRQVALVLPPEEVASPPAWLSPLLGATLVAVAGGVERGDSVAAGLRALDESCTVILVHDGARPFPPRDVIDAGIAAARAGHSAVPALPVGDTIKRADKYGRVLGTVPRDGLWRVQTPQAFPRATLVRAHEAARLEGISSTDDASLVEQLGEVVELLPGAARNIKITTADDAALAAWYLEHP
jgi:2-C-methyl-D-erythritol 4-phosphate cytidylyltransferase